MISRSIEQFFLTVGQNNFGNKIPSFFLSQGKARNFLKILFATLTSGKCPEKKLKGQYYYIKGSFFDVG